MNEPSLAGVTIEISYDAGATWSPMPPGYRQDGRIERVDGDVAVQSIGRGRTVWYRVSQTHAARESPLEPLAEEPG